MRNDRKKVHWHCFGDAEAVAAEMAARVLGAADAAIASRGVFRIVLAGGSTPGRAYRLLAKADGEWSRWEVFFGDERCLPDTHEERNSVMARRDWLDLVSIPAGRIYPIRAEEGPEAAAVGYSKLVDTARPFDLVLLGMGEDGHTASLFPGQPLDVGQSVHAVHGAPKPPADRVTLSGPALADTRALLVVVTGAGKQDAVARWKRGEELPVARVAMLGGADVLVDRDAAG